MHHVSLLVYYITSEFFCTNFAALHKCRYYSGDDPEDAWDMRKALARDEKKQSVIPMDRPVLPQELEW